MQVNHTAIWTSDLDRMKAFLTEDLELEHQKDFEGGDGVTNYFVSAEGGAAIQLKHDPDGNGEVDPSGLAHIAISVDDTDALVDRVTERSDCQIVDGPMTVNDSVSDKRIAFVEGPDGYVFELEQDLG